MNIYFRVNVTFISHLLEVVYFDVNTFFRHLEVKNICPSLSVRPLYITDTHTHTHTHIIVFSNFLHNIGGFCVSAINVCKALDHRTHIRETRVECSQIQISQV